LGCGGGNSPAPFKIMASEQRKTKKAAQKKVAKTAVKKAAKKTAKKVAKKATALKKARKGPRLVVGSKDVMSDTKFTENVHKSFKSINARAKTRPIEILHTADLYKTQIPMNHLLYERLFRNRGWPTAGLVQVIGEERIGKTTLMMDIIGRIMTGSGCPCAYIGCEGKFMSPTHAQRILHRDPVIAEKVHDKVVWMKATTLKQMHDNLEHFAKSTREHYPVEVPIVAVVDPWGKLKSPAEEGGTTEYGMTAAAKKKAKKKDVGEASNLGHAKWSASWTRRLPEFLEKNNMLLFVVGHQDVKIDMNARPGSIPTAKRSNETTIGGKAMKQLSSFIFTVTKQKNLDTPSKQPMGHTVELHTTKNSYGAPRQSAFVNIKFDFYEDDPGVWMESPVDLDTPFSESMLGDPVLGVTATNQLYSCLDLGLKGVSAREFSEALHANPEVHDRLARTMQISGYELWEEDAEDAEEEEGG